MAVIIANNKADVPIRMTFRDDPVLVYIKPLTEAQRIEIADKKTAHGLGVKRAKELADYVEKMPVPETIREDISRLMVSGLANKLKKEDVGKVALEYVTGVEPLDEPTDDGEPYPCLEVRDENGNQIKDPKLILEILRDQEPGFEMVAFLALEKYLRGGGRVKNSSTASSTGSSQESDET